MINFTLFYYYYYKRLFQMKQLISFGALFLVTVCSAAFEGVKPASTCWDPKWKKDISLKDFIPSSVNTALSGGANYEGANGNAGNVGNSEIKSKLGFISNSGELAQAAICIAGLLDTITGKNDDFMLIDVTNESSKIMSLYNDQGQLIFMNPGNKAVYKVYNRYGVFFFKWDNKCYGTRFEKGSSRFTNDNIYIGDDKIRVYERNNGRWDAGCKWFSVTGSFCNGPYNNEKELAFVSEYVENGYTNRCRSAGV